MPEPAAAALGLSELLRRHRHEVGLLHADDDELRNAVPLLDPVVQFGIVVDEQDLELAAVARIDEPWRIEAGDPVSQRQAAPGQDEAGVTRWDGDGQARGHQGASPPRRNTTDVRAARSAPASPDRAYEGTAASASSRWSGTRSIARRYPPAGSMPPVLAWIDLEMTGLDPDRHTIVEIASLLTDDDLTLIEEGPDLVVHATPEQIADMDDVVRAMHTRSGLIGEIQASTTTIEDAAAQTLEFFKKHITEPGTVPLAGNSIGTDRRFLARQMPEIEDFLHYRSVDVSTVKELCRRWCPQVHKAAPVKKGGHRALQDIRESVSELAYYRKELFGLGDTAAGKDSGVSGSPDVSGPRDVKGSPDRSKEAT